MDIERALISKVIATGDLETVITRGINPDHFADEDYRDVYMSIVAHARRYNKPPSTQAFREEHPKFEMLHIEDSINWILERFIGIVKHRRANDAVLELAAACDDPERVKNIDLEFLEIARDLATVVPTTAVARFSDMEKRIEEYEKKKAEGKQSGIPTGFKSLDEWTGGIQPHEFWTVSAFSGIGKSTMMQAMAFNAFMEGFTPLIISLEMEHGAILRRFDAMWAALNYRKLKFLELHDGDVQSWREKAAELRERVNDIPIIDNIRHCTPEHVFGETVKHKPDIVLVDYLTLMRPAGPSQRGGSMWQAITEITQDLKQNARTLKIPVVAAAQLNRSGKDDASTENMGYSISIVQDSDVVIGITRVKDPQKKDEYIPNEVEIHLNKNRDGRLGSFISDWNHEELLYAEKTTMRFQRDKAADDQPKTPFERKPDVPKDPPKLMGKNPFKAALTKGKS